MFTAQFPNDLLNSILYTFGKNSQVLYVPNEIFSFLTEKKHFCIYIGEKKFFAGKILRLSFNPLYKAQNHSIGYFFLSLMHFTRKNTENIQIPNDKVSE